MYRLNDTRIGAVDINDSVVSDDLGVSISGSDGVFQYEMLCTPFPVQLDIADVRKGISSNTKGREATEVSTPSHVEILRC